MSVTASEDDDEEGDETMIEEQSDGWLYCCSTAYVTEITHQICHYLEIATLYVSYSTETYNPPIFKILLIFHPITIGNSRCGKYLDYIYAQMVIKSDCDLSSKCIPEPLIAGRAVLSL